MTDRELLELAAKAAGIAHVTPMMIEWGQWNPLTDDGDALRLAVTLGISVSYDRLDQGVDKRRVFAAYLRGVELEPLGTDPTAATRCAIVRAAAEIGKGIAQSVGDDLPEDNYYKSMAEAEEIGRAAEIGKGMKQPS